MNESITSFSGFCLLVWEFKVAYKDTNNMTLSKTKIGEHSVQTVAT